eukprot:CAMPEP_0174824114 /NCGR_PEP_ID=MMETSP1107-20130205/30751_1 /TAXON_ID=36770 /ORGANISM="Paraphysomonas vestita, Strain GFlagA" /LENGTH=128 /DNA_ID=CAMNT_0016049665 /DNA_START=74 /DNA_END=457 /DNA_ORIENTATION=+
MEIIPILDDDDYDDNNDEKEKYMNRNNKVNVNHIEANNYQIHVNEVNEDRQNVQLSMQSKDDDIFQDLSDIEKQSRERDSSVDIFDFFDENKDSDDFSVESSSDSDILDDEPSVDSDSVSVEMIQPSD